MNNRVVVTGVGALTPLGNTVDEFWESLKKGVNGIGYITKFDTENYKTKIAGELKNFQPEKRLDRKEIKRLDVFSQYALYSAKEAMEDSNIDLGKINKERLGVIIGSGIGGLRMIQSQVIKLKDKGPARVSPLFIPTGILNMAAGNVAIEFGAKGVCEGIVTACATGTSAIGSAFRNIKHGYSDIIIAGGTEDSVTEVGLAGFISITAVSESTNLDRASIPFDKERKGFVMGEGAGILILENYDHAIKRGAKIYGEIVGYGATCDAYHITSPALDGEGDTRAIELALEEGNVDPTQIDYINAHGTGTVLNDLTETIAIKNAFGEYANKVSISSTKSMTGHLLGAAGAVEAIACLKALQENFIPPTINYKVKDEECDLDYTPNKGIQKDIEYVISNSLGFGGHNAVLCFKKWG